MADTRETWQSAWFDRFGAGAYDFVVERARLARIFGRLLWGTDTRRFYERVRVIGELPDGSEILDIACGGGVAFRGLRPEQRVRYVAADLSKGMLRRARDVAADRGLHQIEFVEADVETLPFGDGQFDLAVSFNSIHCFPDPRAAVTEIGRCVKPGGRFIGDSAVRGEGRRFDAVINAYARRGIFGPGGTAEDLRGWLAESGFTDITIDPSGALAHFDAVRA